MSNLKPEQEKKRKRVTEWDEVSETIYETFPASDPPSYYAAPPRPALKATRVGAKPRETDDGSRAEKKRTSAQSSE